MTAEEVIIGLRGDPAACLLLCSKCDVGWYYMRGSKGEVVKGVRITQQSQIDLFIRLGVLAQERINLPFSPGYWLKATLKE